MNEISIVGYCQRTRQFGIGVAACAHGGNNARLAGRAWRGLVYGMGGKLPSASAAEALLERGLKGRALVREVQGGEDLCLMSVDATGRSVFHAGECIRGDTYHSERAECAAASLGEGSASPAFAMLDAFEQASDSPLSERLMRAVEAGTAQMGSGARSAFLRVYDPGIEFPYVDVTVDLHDEPVTQLRLAHDWLGPLYAYYAIRGLNPQVPRYPQWLAAQGIQRETRSK